MRLRVRAVPGSRRASVVGRYGDAWKIRLTSAPEKGRANVELARLLADIVGGRPGDVRVVTGAGARDKLVELQTPLALADVEGLLDAAAGK